MQPTSAAQLGDLQAEAASFVGWGRGPDNGDRVWTTAEQNEINALVKSAVSMFLYPAPVAGVPCDWSFLMPMAEIALPSGEHLIYLPDDFGGFKGKIVLTTTSSTICGFVPLTHEGVIRMNYAADPNSTGRPSLAAEVPLKGTTRQSGQKFQLEFWPLADTDYIVTFPYSVVPDVPTAALPNLYGGPAHAETYKAAVRAAAEQYLDNQRGIEWQNFQERLLASIALDRRSQPRNLGYNGDGSDRDRRGRLGLQNDLYQVTFNGVAYD